MKYLIAFLAFVLVLIGSIEGLFSRNPYLQHDCLCFLLYLAGAIVSFVVWQITTESKDGLLRALGGLAALAGVCFVVVAFVYMMYAFAAGNYCVEHLGNVPRCN
ncbi:MAG TPA: hypothetical protein VHC21_04385 [Candidatus Saccharimonadales bacterium]|nr:hypothetical protein [Candidatus Saccharimonadales bacterium]